LALLGGFVLVVAFNLSTIRSVLFRLSGGETARLIEPATAPVQSFTASEWTKRGRDYLRRYDRPENIDHAIEAFKKATERDPKFAPGFAGLAEANVRKNVSTP